MLAFGKRNWRLWAGSVAVLAIKFGAYLLTGNYRVILDYNCSNFYALSVGLLADAVE